MKTGLAKDTENTTQALAGTAPECSRRFNGFQKIAVIVVLLLAAWALATGTSPAAVVLGSAIALYAIAFIALRLSRLSR